MGTRKTYGGGANWVERSNRHASVLLDNMARFNPESAAFWGVEGIDDNVFQLPSDMIAQQIRANEEAIEVLRTALEAETEPAVRQDLAILIEAAELNIQGIRLNEKYVLPYFNLPATVFQGLRALLDEQIEPSRRPAALVRLRRYTGQEEGYTPITEQAIAFTRSCFDRGVRGPFKDDVEKDLAMASRFIDGIPALFAQFGIEGYEEACEQLSAQLEAYLKFVRDEILPRATEDFRQPAELYRHNLVEFGIDMPLDELMGRAKTAFYEVQAEMKVVAALIAKERGLPSADYRDVIHELKKDQIVADAILPHYEGRIARLEQLVRENNVVTLPEREMRIRLASEAESAALPAPHMRPPRLINNNGEMGEFVLPLRIPVAEGEEDLAFDDFSFSAVSWTLAVHEGRPGHELQFASMVEKGVSLARALFAFNSVNVEGWALYAEAEMKPFLPLEGQLGALQSRLLRAARAFLDPGLQLGEITREEAFRLLEEDVVMSRAMALQEVERYTFRAPGQATSYFCGYCRLVELRVDVERILGSSFDRKAFHDFVLAQGLLPPALLRRAVLEGFVASHRQGSSGEK